MSEIKSYKEFVTYPMWQDVMVEELITLYRKNIILVVVGYIRSKPSQIV